MQQNKNTMKQFLIVILLALTSTLSAQKPCDLSTDVNDSIGTYKSTREYLIYEKNFADNSNYIFASLMLIDGMPTFSLQFIQKSKDFIKANCFDKSSKIYFQLIDGEIVTLYHIDVESCGTLIRDENGYNNRIITGTFMFQKDSFEKLKKSPVSLMRVKYTSDMADFVLKKTIAAELDGKVYEPENYFIDYLHCISDGQ